MPTCVSGTRAIFHVSFALMWSAGSWNPAASLNSILTQAAQMKQKAIAGLAGHQDWSPVPRLATLSLFQVFNACSKTQHAYATDVMSDIISASTAGKMRLQEVSPSFTDRCR